MPWWLLLLPLGYIVATRRPRGAGVPPDYEGNYVDPAGQYNQSVDFGAGPTTLGGQPAGTGYTYAPTIGTKQTKVGDFMFSEQTYTCMNGDELTASNACLRNDGVTYGIKQSGSAMSRSLGGVGKGFTQLGAAASQTASEYSTAVGQVSGQVGELGGQVAGGLAQVASVAQKMGKTVATLDVEQALGFWQQAKNWIDDSDELDGVINED